MTIPAAAPNGGTPTPPPYQPMPDLTPAEYEALKADIAQHGVQVPIEVDEHGAILDGHNRQRICAELGIAAPTITRAGLTEDEKHAHALRLNLQRRHLTSAQKRELIRAELDRDPGRSDREIGRLIGADHKTVGNVRRGEIPRVLFTVARIEHHPAADLFPMVPPEELAFMAASIKRRGLLHPVTLDADGRLLDGKCRLAACELAGVEPHFETYAGDDPWRYVLSINGFRAYLGPNRRTEILEQVIAWKREKGADVPGEWWDELDYWRGKIPEALAFDKAGREAAKRLAELDRAEAEAER